MIVSIEDRREKCIKEEWALFIKKVSVVVKQADCIVINTRGNCTPEFPRVGFQNREKILCEVLAFDPI